MAVYSLVRFCQTPKCLARQVTCWESSGRPEVTPPMARACSPEWMLASEMDLDAAGEVEAAFDGCVDDGGFFETDHRGWPLLCKSKCVAGLI